MLLKGNTWKFGNDIDTDAIIPARYLNTADPKELAKYVMEDATPGFAQMVKPGDILIGGKNFGCGSSREHAPLSIIGAEITCVIAESFARIFYRNCINVGLPIFECAEAAKDIKEGDEISVDTETGVIKNLTTGQNYQGNPFPDFMQELIKAGGLMNYIKEHKMK